MTSINDTGPEQTKILVQPQFTYGLRPAPGTSFFLLREQKALFSAPNEKVYALNDTAALIWCLIEDGVHPDAISRSLVESGVGPEIAKDYVRSALNNWLRRGFLKPHYDFQDKPGPSFWDCLDLKVADFKVSIRFANERIGRLVVPVFEHLRAQANRDDAVVWVLKIDGLVHAIQDGINLFCCVENELVPLLRAHFMDHALENCSPNVAFHAACLVTGQKTVLISGRSGAGKTTLTLRLLEEGFRYGADDVTLISPEGSARGLPFAPAVKSGAVKLVEQFRRDLKDSIVHHRRDRRKIRYLKPHSLAADRFHSVNSIIFIRRVPHKSAKLTPIEPSQVLAKVIAASYSPEGKLSIATISAIKRAVESAAGFELTYSTVDQAAKKIVDLCND